jgi:hypothetical protein
VIAVEKQLLQPRTRPLPYIYSGVQVRQIMAAGKRIGPAEGLRPMVFATVVVRFVVPCADPVFEQIVR